jgi:hypothetical protein
MPGNTFWAVEVLQHDFNLRAPSGDNIHRFEDSSGVSNVGKVLMGNFGWGFATAFHRQRTTVFHRRVYHCQNLLVVECMMLKIT